MLFVIEVIGFVWVGWSGVVSKESFFMDFVRVGCWGVVVGFEVVGDVFIVWVGG